MKDLRLPNLLLITFSLILLVFSTPSVSYNNGNSTTVDEAEVKVAKEHDEFSNVTWANVTWADKSKF